MYPLPPHTVHLVLQYISTLTDPLPPHLISAPLKQRHHFLQIPPSSPVDYLCWPSPDNAKVIDLLDRLHPIADQTSYPTRYTSDPESVFAHVQISQSADGLCMLFHWDATDGWKYHDLRMMPFPHSSFSTPQESLASTSASVAGPLQHSSLHRVAEADRSNNADDDSYWDAYGATDEDLISPLPPSSTSKPSTVDAEDAYWAQYNSVQGVYLHTNSSPPDLPANAFASSGSADSTVPSPLPISRKLQPTYPNGDESVLPLPPQHEHIIDVPVDAIHSRTPGVGPPSPNVLTHLLNSMSPRKDTYSPDFDDPSFGRSPSAYSLDPSSAQTTADSELITPPLLNGYTDASVTSPVAVKTNGVPLPNFRSYPDEAEDKALMDSIKGLYYLWKAGRKGEPDMKDRIGFFQLVQAAISYD